MNRAGNSRIDWGKKFSENGKSSGEVLEVIMLEGDKGAREQKVSGKVKRTVWLVP